MANSIDRLVMAGLISLLALPVQAQEMALEQPSPSSSAQAGHSMQIRPISTSAPAQESVSNLKHWSRFSQAAAKPMFVRVPAGSQANSGESHYIRPKCIQAGSIKATAQNTNGPVKRYLAYNVPPGGSQTKSSTAGANTQKKTSSQKAKSNNGQVVVLGYGKNSGEITYSTMPSSSKTLAVSCYPRYR